ncbi:MAG: response regulator transcription factor [bacterium]
MNTGQQAAPVKIALVEDDKELRTGLAGYLRRFPEFVPVAAFGDGETALAELPRLKPEVVVMDINLPGMDGIECVRGLKEALPGALFMMLTVYEDNDRLFDSLLAGASGYLLKRAAPSEIAAAIRDLRSGGSPMTPQIARRVVQHYQQKQAKGLPEEESGELSQRQQDFLDQLAKGYRYKEIADNLGIGMDGVRSYIRRIYEKLHVHSRTEAVVKYLGR